MLHELSHIRHHNHGPGFQALLKELTEVCPLPAHSQLGLYASTAGVVINTCTSVCAPWGKVRSSGQHVNTAALHSPCLKLPVSYLAFSTYNWARLLQPCSPARWQVWPACTQPMQQVIIALLRHERPTAISHP